MMQLFTSDTVKIICLIAGIVFMCIETLLPGFGIAGISGGIMLGVGTACMWIQHGATAGLVTLMFALILTVIAAVLAIRSAEKGKLSKSRLILQRETETESVNRAVNPGDTGETATVLNPVGFAVINGKRLEVLSESGLIAKGSKIAVTSVENKKIKVDKI